MKEADFSAHVDDGDDDLRCWSCSQFYHHRVQSESLITHLYLVFFSLSVALFVRSVDSEASPDDYVERSSSHTLWLASLLTCCSLRLLCLAPLLTHFRSVHHPKIY